MNVHVFSSPSKHTVRSMYAFTCKETFSLILLHIHRTYAKYTIISITNVVIKILNCIFGFVYEHVREALYLYVIYYLCFICPFCLALYIQNIVQYNIVFNILQKSTLLLVSAVFIYSLHRLNSFKYDRDILKRTIGNLYTDRTFMRPFMD